MAEKKRREKVIWEIASSPVYLSLTSQAKVRIYVVYKTQNIECDYIVIAVFASLTELNTKWLFSNDPGSQLPSEIKKLNFF